MREEESAVREVGGRRVRVPPQDGEQFRSGWREGRGGGEEEEQEEEGGSRSGGGVEVDEVEGRRTRGDVGEEIQTNCSPFRGIRTLL